MSDETFSTVEDAWHQHSVLRFRGQQLNDDALAAFSRRFGIFDTAPVGRGGTPYNPDRPEITVLSNIVVDGKALPADLAKRIEGVHCKHDATRTSSGELRHGYQEAYSNDERPVAVHLLVVRHPASGRNALYLGRRHNAWIVGMSEADRDALLDALWSHIQNHNFVWTQQWQPGDLVIWDNRCALHRRNQLDPSTRRLMHRTRVRGDAKPVAGWN